MHPRLVWLVPLFLLAVSWSRTGTPAFDDSCERITWAALTDASTAGDDDCVAEQHELRSRDPLRYANSIAVDDDDLGKKLQRVLARLPSRLQIDAFRGHAAGLHAAGYAPIRQFDSWHCLELRI